MEQDKMQAVGDFDIKQRKRKKIATIVIFLIIFGIFAFWGGLQLNKWWQARKELIDMGFASNKFPFRMYTERELVEKGLWSGESPALNAVPTRTTPEETYAKFRQALIDGDLDKAAECFMEEKREERKNDLLKAQEEGRIPKIIKILNDISRERGATIKGGTGDAYVDYELLYKEPGNEKFTSHTITFYKNWDGDWLMEDI